MDDLYPRLSDEKHLKESWHLAHRETRETRARFMLDALGYSDFAFHLDEYLKFISRSLKNESYHPKPLQRIDVPKSEYAVRPGSTVSIEDRIVLYAIALLIAPVLDKKLPSSVYSWRVKHGRKAGENLFRENTNLQSFPFLKSKTIGHYIDIIEPWYERWPDYIKNVTAAYAKGGYKYMAVSDITAYFENIDLALLREFLMNHLGRNQQRIVNFLIRILSHWTWPATNWFDAPRGIPQGNGVSSFLGNFYLLEVDQMFKKFSHRNRVKYFRYMDDFKILSKDYYDARDSLLEINNKLRELRLGVQGAKTKILQDSQIREHLYDSKEMKQLNSIIETTQKGNINQNTRKRYKSELKDIRKQTPRAINDPKKSRFYLRVITAHSHLQDPGMVTRVLGQIKRNPDHRVVTSAYRYFKGLTASQKSISDGIIDLLNGNQKALLEFQRAWLFTILRHTCDVSPRAVRIAKSAIDKTNNHWYLREQAAIFYGTRCLTAQQKKYALRKYEEEILPASKRAWIHGLSQLSPMELEKIADNMLLDTDPEIHRMGKMVYDLLHKEISIQHISNHKKNNGLFDNFEDLVQRSALVDRIWEIELLSKNKHETVRKELLRCLQKHSSIVKPPFLRERWSNITKMLP